MCQSPLPNHVFFEGRDPGLRVPLKNGDEHIHLPGLLLEGSEFVHLKGPLPDWHISGAVGPLDICSMKVGEALNERCSLILHCCASHWQAGPGKGEKEV